MTDAFEPRKLLVSVRSVREAVTALAGGADIIDVKEPRHGSLGRAADSVIAEICAEMLHSPFNVSVSAALGEVNEFSSCNTFRLPEGVHYAKLGLSQLRREARWVDQWREVRSQFQKLHGSEVQWIAVIYADDVAAATPPPSEIILAAVETGCAGVLVDTWSKSGGRLLDHVSPVRLSEWAGEVHQADLFFAIAGRLSTDDLPRLANVPADIIAVRSAVCDGEDRQSTVNAERVCQLRAAIDRMPDSRASTDHCAARLIEH